jgi:hypothetical protein
MMYVALCFVFRVTLDATVDRWKDAACERGEERVMREEDRVECEYFVREIIAVMLLLCCYKTAFKLPVQCHSSAHAFSAVINASASVSYSGESVCLRRVCTTRRVHRSGTARIV